MTPRALVLAAFAAFVSAVAAPVLADEADPDEPADPVEDAAPPSAQPAPAPEPSGASGPPIVIGLEHRQVTVQHTDRAMRRTIPAFGPGLFVRSGLLHVGLSAEFQVPLTSPDWYAPGTTFLRRTGTGLWFTFGPSVPGTALGTGGVARHLRLELLGEVGLVSTKLVEELGGGGIGDRTWRKTTPVVGGRVGARFRFGGRWGGHFGVAGFYRQPVGDERITTVTGVRMPVVGSTFGLLLFGGPDVQLRR